MKKKITPQYPEKSTIPYTFSWLYKYFVFFGLMIVYKYIQVYVFVYLLFCNRR